MTIQNIIKQENGNTLGFLLVGSSIICLLTIVGIYTYQHKEAKLATQEKDVLVTELRATNKETSQLQEKLFEFEDTNKRLNHELVETKEQNQIITKENTHLKDKISTITATNNSLIEYKKGLSASVENLKSEKTALLEQVRTMESKSFITDTLKEKAMLEIQVTRLKEELKKANLNNKASLNKAQQYHTQESKKIQKQVMSLEDQLEKSKNDQDKIALLREDIKMRSTTIRNLERKIEDANTLIESISQTSQEKIEELAKQRKKIMSIQNEYNVTVNQLAETQKKLAVLEDKYTHSQNKNEENNREIKDLQSQLKVANAKLQLRLQELGRAKDSIEKIMTRTRHSILSDNSVGANTMIKAEHFDRPTQTNNNNSPKSNGHYLDITQNKSQLEKTLKGTIIEIDRKYDFVIIDLGAQDGVNDTMDVRIKQNNKIVANANLVEVREDISAANIKILGDFAVQPGDIVELVAHS